MPNGWTPFELLRLSQVDAAAETLWNFAWNDDPNDPDCFKKVYADATKDAKDHYREWARAILLAAETSKPQHTWDRDFPRVVREPEKGQDRGRPWNA